MLLIKINGIETQCKILKSAHFAWKIVFDFEHFINGIKNVTFDMKIYLRSCSPAWPDLQTPESNIYYLTRQPCCDDRSASTPTFSSTAFYHSQPVQPNPVAAAQSAGGQVGVPQPRPATPGGALAVDKEQRGQERAKAATVTGSEQQGREWGRALWTRVENEYLKK